MGLTVAIFVGGFLASLAPVWATWFVLRHDKQESREERLEGENERLRARIEELEGENLRLMRQLFKQGGQQ